MIKKHKLFLINIFLSIIVIINIFLVNKLTSNRIIEYSTMLASKITKSVVSNAYNSVSLNMEESELYDIIKNSEGEIKTVVYDIAAVNKLLSIIKDKVFSMFNEIETRDIRSIGIRDDIINNRNDKNYLDGIVLEIPSLIFTDNYLLSNLGPRVPIKVTLTGEFESYISTTVEEYGINNALVSMYVNIVITEQVTMPFITEKISIENRIPVAIYLINGKIPDYYMNGFDTSSNIYKTS